MNNPLLTSGLVIIGVPAAVVGYILLIEFILRFLPSRIVPRVRPYLWITPALAFLAVFLVYPTIDTIRRSFMDRYSEKFVGLANYEYLFGSKDVITALVNNLLWLVFLT